MIGMIGMVKRWLFYVFVFCTQCSLKEKQVSPDTCTNIKDTQKIKDSWICYDLMHE